MLKINLLRKRKKQHLHPFSQPSFLLALAATLFLAACGKSDVGDGSGISVAASVTAPGMTANLQSQCSLYGGQITVAADGAQVCKYPVANLSSTSSGFSLNFSCNLFSSQMAVGTGVNVASGDTITMQTTKSVGVYVTNGFTASGMTTVNGAGKLSAPAAGQIALYVTVPSGCSSSSGLSTFGVSSIKVDRCLDSANQPHLCN